MTGPYHMSDKIETYNFRGVPEVTVVGGRPFSAHIEKKNQNVTIIIES
jgi:hypothetical protein